MKKVITHSINASLDYEIPTKLEWSELNGADQLAVERAIQYINYEGMDTEDAIRRAVNEINDSYMEPEYADEDADFWGGGQEASKNVVRYYIEDHPELINPQPRSFRRSSKVQRSL